MKKLLKFFFIFLIIIVLVYGVAGNRIYSYVLLKIVSMTKPSVAPNHEVVWEQGPSAAETPIGERPPNIILILVDDLGYNDLTFAGGGAANGSAPTPNIDSLADGGVSFTNGYAGNATCAPSRAALMTGRYPTRFGFEFTPVSKRFSKVLHRLNPSTTIYNKDVEDDVPPYEEMVMPLEEITLAELLRERGYHTLMVGKWHLGGTTDFMPNAQGFDEWLGFEHGAALFMPVDHPQTVNSRHDYDAVDKFLWAALPYAVRHNGGERFAPKGHLTEYMTDEAIKAIEANRNRPFFLYLSYSAPHTPLQALKSDYEALAHIKHHPTRVYAAMIRQLDREIGRVLAALKKNGLEENTLLMFTSDNGGAFYLPIPDINKPYRGWKATFFEGGLHVPYFMKWPAGLPQGATFDQPVMHFDMFATAAAAAGAAMPSDRKMDGINLIPFVKGDKEGAPHQALFWRSGHYKTVLANGWKLQLVEKPVYKVWLYNLDQDPTEKRNLAGQYPEKVTELKALLAAYDKEQAKPLWPCLLEGQIAVDHQSHIPITESDETIYWSN